MKRFTLSLLVMLAAFGWVACTNLQGFVADDAFQALKEKEGLTYVLKKDVRVNERSLKKGREIRLVFAVGSDWIKVLGYPAEVPRLKADLVLLLYLFEEDFPGGKFDMTVFMKKLDQIVARKGA